MHAGGEEYVERGGVDDASGVVEGGMELEDDSLDEVSQILVICSPHVHVPGENGGEEGGETETG